MQQAKDEGCYTDLCERRARGIPPLRAALPSGRVGGSIFGKDAIKSIARQRHYRIYIFEKVIV